MAFVQQILPDSLRRKINIWRFKNYQLGKTSKKSSIAAFDYYRCIYVHIPKTGGISINDALWGNPGGVHKTLGDYLRIFGQETLDEYYKFTIVRNPFDRLVSAFAFLKAGGQHADDYKWAQTHLKDYTSFESFIKNWLTKENIYKGIHFIPQTAFLKVGGEMKMDFIGRLENMNDDFNTIKNHIGLVDAQLPHKNKSKRSDYRDYYTQESRSIVENVYADDLELLGYTFDSSQTT